MPLMMLVVLLSSLLMSFVAPAYQQKPHSHEQSHNRASPAWTELRESMQHMHTAMASVTSTSDSDRDFVRVMIPHHQAALEMAKTELGRGTDPQIKRLAQEIIAEQQSEIELMQLWLQRRPVSSEK